MTWVLGISIGAIVTFAVVVARALRSVPNGRPNYAEKELTSTAYDFNQITPKKKGRKFFIREDGEVDVRTYCCQ